MSAEENEALVRRYFEEGWVKRNLAAVDDFMVPNYVEHQIPDGRLTSRHSLKQLLAMYYKAFPDMKSVLHDIFAQGDKAMYRWSVSATHLGEWLGIPPTGNHMRATGITIYRIVEGKAVEGWSSVAISRSEEEQRWLSEGGTTDKAYPESGDISLPGLDLERSPAFDALIRNLTWRFRAAEARERERIEHELQVARRIQQELLPEATPELDGWQIAAYYGPAREVGGDFYDFLEFADGRIGLVVGDATGHGMPAALMMATTRGMLRAVVQSLESPGEVLARVNEAMVADVPPSTFVTCFYGILDPKSGHLVYANAGHDLPYLWHGGATEELRARGMPLGLMPGMGYEEKQITLKRGEGVLFYSDGLVEAHDPHYEMFGFPRLRALLADHGEERSLVDFLMEELSSFTGQSWEQEDDITLMTLQRSAAHR
ncbi:MAG TPA: SpoIIE family protein phosphatase [Rubrobacter sp.]|nr:SpoIIE family protein phosphatase [Rubrobacter sp.]